MAPLEGGSSALVPSVPTTTEVAYQPIDLDGVWDSKPKGVSKMPSKCSICGAEVELVRQQNYLGGHGYVWDWTCADGYACWALRDQQDRGPEMARTANSGAAQTTPLL